MPRQVADGVWMVTAGSFPANSYIVAANVPGGAVLIDAGLDPEPIDAAFAELGMVPAHVLCTHGHFDHVGSASFFQNKYGAPVYLHRADKKTAAMCNFLLNAMKMPDRIVLPVFTLVDDGFSMPLGARTARYRSTPGHTPGSCTIAIGNDLFSGDTLYARGLGRSKLPGERPDELRRSIKAVWDDLDTVTVYPGHGRSASGADIKGNNAELLAFLNAEPAMQQRVANG